MPMNIVVLIKLVPDLIEEVEIDPNGQSVDTTFMRLIINEPDDHALEQAILLKEREGGEVTVIGPSFEDIDGVLFTAAAKATDRQIRLSGEFNVEVNNHALARAFADAVRDIQPDLILTGVQAHNDLDGAVGPLLAGYLEMPYVGYVAGVAVEDGSCVVRKEYPGGWIGEFQVEMPAVLGIQSAESPPRYVAVSKVRQAMKTVTLDEQPSSPLDESGGAVVSRVFLRESAERAEMIEGDIDTIADKLVELLQTSDVL
jgi:electron transfer flavoprotein beta subunit